VLDTIISHLPAIGSFISAVLGGGLVTVGIKLYRTYWTQLRKNDQQEHDIELSNRLEQRLGNVENRLDTAEAEVRETKEKLSETKKELTDSNIKRRELRAAIQQLVQRIDRLIDRLEKHESISEEERERLTKAPFTDE
jgi:peptidoglycan hydrolase CwlO-like protein